jgi:hypothetical protein
LRSTNSRVVGSGCDFGAGATVTVDDLIDPRPVLIVTGLVQEARTRPGPA